MAEAEVKILTVDAVQNMNDLRKAIHDTKEELAKYELGTEDYQRVLGDLIREQNLMRGALNGTTASMDDLKKAAAGATDSYNGLVNKMADLTRKFRATKDAAERANLGAQIKEINDQLKEMDAMRGNFQRNVGDYFNQTSAAMKSVIKDLPSALDKVKGPLRDIEGTMGLMGKHPILGIIGLLAPLLAQVANSLKEDESAMAGVKKVMDALKPVTDFFAGLLEQIVDVLEAAKESR
jgi:ABC-type transporter Mla subunit MlaD